MKISLKILTLLILVGCVSCRESVDSKKPKLIVGIVIDQMRFDRIYKYQDRYTDDGFKKLMNQGFVYDNAHYSYVPTQTAPGHASIYSGTTPSHHGIIGNDWYDQSSRTYIDNVTDATETIIGIQNDSVIGRSPKRMLCSTITDQLRLSNNFQSKVISVSFKDRGAILPGGHTANAAYWYDWENSSGYFVSSSYYMNAVPQWVMEFNLKGYPNNYLDSIWSPLFPIESYDMSTSDSARYERKFSINENTTVFPKDFKVWKSILNDDSLRKKFIPTLMRFSHLGDLLLSQFAQQAIINENLGKNEHTDFLNISFSVPDEIGHWFGPQSIEIEDIFLRLDQQIANLIDFLDKEVGKDEYLLFLTSDHGIPENVSYLNDMKLPSGLANISSYRDALKNHLRTKYNATDFINSFDWKHVYLNHESILNRGLDIHVVQDEVAQFLLQQEGIRYSLSAYNLSMREYTSGLPNMIQNGFHPKRSGDVLLEFEPGFVMSFNPTMQLDSYTGAQHSTGWEYDSHVPMLWYGTGINAGRSVRKVSTTDIAPTIAMFLSIQMPNCTTGHPLTELFE